MSEQKPLTISQLIKVLKEVKKQAGDLPVMFYTGEENGIKQCEGPEHILIIMRRFVVLNFKIKNKE